MLLKVNKVIEMKRVLLLFIAILLVLSGCDKPETALKKTEIADQNSQTTEASEPTETVTLPQLTEIEVEPVEGLSKDFLLGADVSSLIALENSGMVYRNFQGEPQDLIQTLHEAGVNAIRVRIWNDPYDSRGNGYGGGNCDLATAIEIGKRAARYSMSLLVDFHYSDFWADPGKQQAPKAWEKMDLNKKTEAIKAYTKDSLQAFLDAGITVAMVQIGNETTGGFCGEWTVEGQYTLMAAAAEAVRGFDPNISIVVHYTNPEKGGYPTFAQRLEDYQVDYDIFASSYYPAWHGTLENLTNQLCSVAEGYGKQVMVAETAWDNITYDANPNAPYPYSQQGQADALTDVIGVVNGLGDAGVGVFYWEPAWIEVPGLSWERRSELWEQHGSGWASSYSAEYDPEDAGKYYGGSACVKQALFDENGCPLEVLLTFAYVREST